MRSPMRGFEMDPVSCTPGTSLGAGAAGAPTVSVIIPARNAGAAVDAAIESVLAQDYTGRLEVIVADGSSPPARDALRSRWGARIAVVRNPAGTTSAGLNAALRHATGAIVARCDAHAVLPPGYLRHAVATSARTGAANVGGRQWPVGRTPFERAVALAMTAWLGTGGARHRLGGSAGPVDTVYLGVFRREALDRAGAFDPTLERNQDYELNWRLRTRGETVWFDPALIVAYRPRGSLGELGRQYFDYGRWKAVMLRRHPRSLQLRHLASPLLVLGLAVSLLLGTSGEPAGVVLPAAYIATLAGGAVAIGARRREPAAVLLPMVLSAMHLSWGGGFLFSMLRAMGRVRRP